METGTGKTYCLHPLHLRAKPPTASPVRYRRAERGHPRGRPQEPPDHPQALRDAHDRTPFDYFVYDSKDMGPRGNFATSSSIQVMVINIDAFNKRPREGWHREGGQPQRPAGLNWPPCQISQNAARAFIELGDVFIASRRYGNVGEVSYMKRRSGLTQRPSRASSTISTGFYDDMKAFRSGRINGLLHVRTSARYLFRAN